MATVSGPASVDEGGTATYEVTLDRSPVADVDVTWAVTGGGSDPAVPTAVAADFVGGTLPTGTVSFDAGATGAALTRTFEVAIADDDADELDTETFTVTLGTGSPDAVAVGTPPASRETTVTDGDVPVAALTGPGQSTEHL